MTHQKFEGERTLMRVHIGESDKWHGKPLHEAIVEMLRKEGFSGVTVLRGVAGYGSSSVYHTDKLLRLSQDLPIVLEVIESQERVEQILPKMDEMVDGGLITLEKVRVILYRPAKHSARTANTIDLATTLASTISWFECDAALRLASIGEDFLE
jgi:PII-like signaling protein